jgi:hypothetical protein
MLALLAAFAVACLLFVSRPCARDMRLFLASLCQQLLLSLLGLLAGLRLLGGVAAASHAANTETMPLMPSFKRKRAAVTVENAEEAAGAAAGGEPSVLDLPELAIDCILERLQPAELRSMAAVCRSMRERCRSDHLWERHMTSKWGRVLGRAARDEWRTHVASASESGAVSGGGGGGKRRRWLAALSCVCPVVSWMRPRPDGGKSSAPVLDDSIMSWYLSMESGKFWFPAQVYNREVPPSHVLSVPSLQSLLISTLCSSSLVLITDLLVLDYRKYFTSQFGLVVYLLLCSSCAHSWTGLQYTLFWSNTRIAACLHLCSLLVSNI